jgi:hypothetical protein
MKNFVSLLSLLILFGCGPSDEEKQNTAIITCNILEESNIMDAAMRIKEINEAREKLNEDPFLFGNNEINQALQYELCTNLVLNDPNYEFLLEERRLAEEEARKKRLAKIEEKRLAEEEAERIKKQKEEEAEQIATQRTMEKMKANGFCEIVVVGIRERSVLISDGNDYKALKLGESYKTSKDSFTLTRIWDRYDDILVIWENEKTGDKFGNAIDMTCE